MIYKKFKYISVYYNPIIESISQMCLEHYDIPEYEDTLFLLNVTYENNCWLNKDDFTESKIIFYNLEHLEVSYNYFNTYFKNFINWLIDLKTCEIWDFCIENIKYYPNTFNLKFVPVRYTETLLDNPLDIPKKYDLCMVGILQNNHPHRINIISDIQYLPEIGNYYDASLKTLKGYPIFQLKNELSDCKYILDTLSTRPTNSNICTQNQVRIFECIMRGYNVITEEVNGINYFPGCVKTFEYPADDERIDGYAYGINLLNFLGNEPYIDNHIMYREEYKKLTYKDEDFENYKNAITEQYKLLIH